ncbi:MAG: CapA family protein [Clostridia bacterium]|nr:CapA family protein [Clostridia bacterium]
MSKLILSATGDSLFTADIPREYFDGDFVDVFGFMRDADVRMTNLETNIGEFGGFPGAYSGGTWLNCTPDDFGDLVRFGFNYYSIANNHCMDYSYHGLLSTIDNLDKRGLAHSGTGRSLSDAGAPAALTAEGTKIGIISLDTSFNDASKAGYSTDNMEARPGVNYLGFQQYFPIDKDQLQQLKAIADTSLVNAREELRVREGFVSGSADGVYRFGGVNFCFDGSRKKSECDKKDKQRIIASIKDAKKSFDYVILAVHCHAIGGTKHSEIPLFLEEICHDSVDAGVSAVICNGTHELRPLEIYHGAPIFYSLGDFIYQGMRVKYLPPDFMTKYNVDINASAYEGLMARSKNGKIGLQTKKCNFLTVIPKMVFEDGKLISLSMLPVVAGFCREGKMNGLPYTAKGEEAEEIFNILKELSEPYGTCLEIKDGLILLKQK